MRGSKHWPKSTHAELWAWIAERLPQMFERIRPDTLRIWEGMLTVSIILTRVTSYLIGTQTQLSRRDPRRHPVLVDFIKGLPTDFDNESAFVGQ